MNGVRSKGSRVLRCHRVQGAPTGPQTRTRPAAARTPRPAADNGDRRTSPLGCARASEPRGSGGARARGGCPGAIPRALLASDNVCYVPHGRPAARGPSSRLQSHLRPPLEASTSAPPGPAGKDLPGEPPRHPLDGAPCRCTSAAWRPSVRGAAEVRTGPARPRGARRPARTRSAFTGQLAVQEAPEVERRITEVRRQPDEVAVDRVHGVFDRKRGLASQVAGTLLVDETVLGSHATLIPPERARAVARRLPSSPVVKPWNQLLQHRPPGREPLGKCR